MRSGGMIGEAPLLFFPFHHYLITSKPTQPKKGWPHHRGMHRSLSPLLFSNSGVGSLKYHGNWISESAVCRIIACLTVFSSSTNMQRNWNRWERYSKLLWNVVPYHLLTQNFAILFFGIYCCIYFSQRCVVRCHKKGDFSKWVLSKMPIKMINLSNCIEFKRINTKILNATINPIIAQPKVCLKSSLDSTSFPGSSPTVKLDFRETLLCFYIINVVQYCCR